MEMKIRSVVLFALLLVIGYTKSTKVVTVSRRINGTVTGLSESYIFVMTVVGDPAWFSVVAYPKGGKCCDPHSGIDIVSPDSQTGDCFGEGIVSNSKFVAVSARGYNNQNGAVFIYTVNEHKFTFQQKLVPDAERYWRQLFGHSIAINENNDIVIESGNNVYIFAFQNLKWMKVRKFSHSLVHCVDISEDTIVVANGPSVYIYNKYDGIWTLAHTLTPQTQYNEITRVKLYKHRLYVTDSDSRNVFVYKPTWRWTLTQTITRKVDTFGCSFAIYDNIMIVGAPGVEPGNGTAYIFEFDKQRQMWSEKTQLKASDVSSDVWFSNVVAIDSHFVFLSKMLGMETYTYIYEYKRTAKHIKKTLPHYGEN